MLLKHNDAFRNLFLGRIFNVFADSVMFFSLLKWIEIQSNESSAFTLFYVAFYLPITLFALPIGAWLDNKTLQKVMAYSTAIRVVMLIIFLAAMPYLAYQWVYVLLIIVSILGLFFVPANQALLPHIVEIEYRPSANSLLQLGFTAVKIFGQVFTAFMIKLSILPSTLLIASVILLLLSLFFIKKIKPLVKKEQVTEQSQWERMKEGIRYITKHIQLKPLFSILALAMFFVASVDLVLISFLNEVLFVGVENLGFIGTSSLLGIAVGAAIVPKWYKRIERKWLIIPPLFALCLSIGSLFFITHWVMILPFFFMQGIALGCFNVTFVTYLQDVVSSENYTRTFSLYNMIASSMALPGVLLVGALLNRIGVLNTILVLSGILLLIGIFGIYLIPQLGKGRLTEFSDENTA
ncbi:MFS transporter [Cytobacillus dafuensis]|uniref:MFS transporter n=1 Tax=Cytobacillus dafuensis TaxID=1742359 RepID=UPI00070C45BA|nr:MFS transporter [Cytobacillus dafuensis]